MKKKLSRIAAVLLAVVMVITGISVAPVTSVKAAEPPKYTIRTSAASVKPGDTITAELWLEPGSDLEYFVLNFQYDTNIFDTVSRKKGSLIADMDMALVDYDPGNISIVADLAECAELGTDPYGQVYIVNLKVKDSATGAGNMGIEFIGGKMTDNTDVTAKDVDVVCQDKAGNVIEGGNLPVVIELESIAINQDDFTMAKGSKASLGVTATPEAAMIGKKVEWSSDNNQVATIDNSGNVTAVGIGEATITAKVGDKSDTVKITVNAPLNGISLDKSAITLKKGTSEKLTVVYDPEDTTDDKTVTWNSSDPAVATVDNTGNITALKDGVTTITATVGDFSATCNVTVQEVKLQSISLDKSTLALERGNVSDALKVTYNPENTTDDKTVTWTSDDENIATVKDGVVTAVGIGTATITAKVGAKTAECEVTVTAPLQSISLDKSNVEILKNASDTVNVTLNPTDTTDITVVNWELTDGDQSAAEIVAQDNTSATVKGLKAGTVTLRATAQTDSGITKTADCVVTVAEKPVTGLTITSDKAADRLEKGDKVNLSVKYEPEETTDEKSVTWTSLDENVAQVDENGTVTAVAGGETTIVATLNANTNITAEFKVKVLIHTTGITLDKSELEVLKGQTAAPLMVNFEPANTEDSKEITWSSNDEKVAIVDATGRVSGLKEGTAVITATTADGKFSADCTVTVMEKHLTDAALSEDTPNELLVGQVHTLNIIFAPIDTTDFISCAFKSSDESVVKVNGECVVTALKAGEADITITVTANGFKKEIVHHVTVKDIPLESIAFKEKVTSLEEGKTAQLEILFNPENTTVDRTIEWNSSDPSVATIEKGLVKAIKAGKTKITAKVGEQEISYELTVTEKKKPVTPENKPEQNSTNNSGAVKTGDTNNIFGIMLTMLLSLAVLSLVVVLKSKGKRLHR